MWCKTALFFVGIVTLEGQVLQRHPFTGQRRQNPKIIPRILNRNSEILSLGFQNSLKPSQRRIESDSTFTPSKTIDFDLEFTHLDDIEQEPQESQTNPVVLKTDKLSNPLQYKMSKSSGV